LGRSILCGKKQERGLVGERADHQRFRAAGHRRRESDGASCRRLRAGVRHVPKKLKTQNSKLKTNKNDNDIDIFLETGKKALNEAIKQAKVGNHIGDISKTIQDIVEDRGYSVVRTLVGHGVGRQLHEDPEIPGFLSEPIEKTPLLKEGMTIAIEVIYNMGGPDLKLDKDGWTLRTEDGSLAGLYERTVAITKNGPLVLTK